MPDFFVSVDRGSDSTGDGTANNPWKTVNKAIGTAPAITLPGAGETVLWIEPGVYREAVTLGLSPSSAAPLTIRGDIDGAGFAAGGKASPKTGVVSWRAWSNATTPIASPCFTASGKSNVAIRRISFVGGSFNNANCLALYNASDIVVADCEFSTGMQTGSGRQVDISIPAGGSPSRISRCDFDVPGSGTSRMIYVTADRADADYAAGLVVENCRFRGGSRPIDINPGGGAKTGGATGHKITCCTFSGCGAAAVYVAAAVPASAVTVTGCAILAAGGGIQAATLGQIIEDYNVLNANAPRTNVATGTNSVAGVDPTINLDSGRMGGSFARPYAEPLAGSSLLGFLPRPSGLTVDLYGRSRPNPCAAGCLERGDEPAPEPGGNTYIFQTEG